MLEVCVVETCRILQPKSQQPIHADMPDPNESVTQEAHLARQNSTSDEEQWTEVGMNKIVRRRAESCARQVTQHREIGSEK